MEQKWLLWAFGMGRALFWMRWHPMRKLVSEWRIIKRLKPQLQPLWIGSMGHEALALKR